MCFERCGWCSAIQAMRPRPSVAPGILRSEITRSTSSCRQGCHALLRHWRPTERRRFRAPASDAGSDVAQARRRRRGRADESRHGAIEPSRLRDMRDDHSVSARTVPRVGASLLHSPRVSGAAACRSTKVTRAPPSSRFSAKTEPPNSCTNFCVTVRPSPVPRSAGFVV